MAVPCVPYNLMNTFNKFRSLADYSISSHRIARGCSSHVCKWPDKSQSRIFPAPGSRFASFELLANSGRASWPSIPGKARFVSPPSDSCLSIGVHRFGFKWNATRLVCSHVILFIESNSPAHFCGVTRVGMPTSSAYQQLSQVYRSRHCGAQCW